MYNSNISTPNKLCFGTAGIPLCSTGKNIRESIQDLVNLSLDSMEVEFVRNIFLNELSAKELGNIAKESNILLTCHCPYFINLNALEKEKYDKSIQRIINSAIIAHYFGGYSVTFHAGYYLNQDKKEVYEKIKTAITHIVSELKKRKVFIYIRPELTGKETQFGDLDEIIQLSKEIDMVLPCIDFAHYNARYNGNKNNIYDYEEIFLKIKQELGIEALKNMHCHIAGINYSEKGERNHLNLLESDMLYAEIVKLFNKYEIKGTIVSESPNIETDAKFLKKLYLGNCEK